MKILSRAVLACLPLVMTLAASASAVQVTQFALPPNSRPMYITAGPGGDMWFTDAGTNEIGRITMAGEVTEFGLGLTSGAGLSGIAAGPEGNVWFTERDGKRIGRITPAGVITELTAGLTNSPDIYGITAGPNGDLWFTETYNSRIGEVDPLSGQIMEFPVATTVYTNIVAGPDGNLWFTSPEAATIDNLTPAGAQSVVVSLPNTDCASGASAPCPYPEAIAVGPEGDLWFDEARGDQIGKITTGGSLTEYTTGLSRGAGVADLVAGPEGNMWFTEANAAQVGRITPVGTISEFGTGFEAKSRPFGIALGPDENLWIAEPGAGEIARVIPDVPPAASTGPPSAVSSTSASVTGAVRSRGADTHYVFEYGPTTAYGQSTPVQDNGSGDATQTVSAMLTGLSPRRTYHYRLVAINGSGASYGADAQLTTTTPPPTVAVGAFEMYFHASALGSGRLELSEIVVIGLRPGVEVSYDCKRCSGADVHRARRATGHTVRLDTRGLVVSARSVLRIVVAAGNGSSRARWYGFHISEVESFLKRERCYLQGSPSAVRCPGSRLPVKHVTKGRSHHGSTPHAVKHHKSTRHERRHGTSHHGTKGPRTGRKGSKHRQTHRRRRK